MVDLLSLQSLEYALVMPQEVPFGNVLVAFAFENYDLLLCLLGDLFEDPLALRRQMNKHRHGEDHIMARLGDRLDELLDRPDRDFCVLVDLGQILAHDVDSVFAYLDGR